MRSRWLEASEIAAIAMGKAVAESDPLAWWCLTELIYNYGALFARLAKKASLASRVNERLGPKRSN